MIPLAVVHRFAGRMLNVHPALLPAFGGKGMYGRHVHEAVLAAGCFVSGVTVHLVEEQYDEGPIIAQWPVPVLAGDTADTLAARVLRVEHAVFPFAVEAIARRLHDSPRHGFAATDPAGFAWSEGSAELLAGLRHLYPRGKGKDG